MLNLIKMDLYRLSKTKSLKIGLIISAIISFVSISIIAGLANLVPQFDATTQATLTMMMPFADWRTNVSFYEIILTATSMLSLMVSAVLASIFISEEQANGYIKNIAGQVKSKGMMTVSKFVALAVMTLFVLLAYTAGAALSGHLFLNNAITYDGLSHFLAVFGTKYLIYLSVNAIILFLCTLTKSKSLSIALGDIFGSGASIIAYNIISTFLGIIFKCDIPLTSYVPDGLVFDITMDAPSDALIKATVVGIVYIAIFMAFSMVLMKKRDTR